MMKRTAIALFSIVLAAAALAGEPHAARYMRHFTEALNLTPSQQAAWENALRDNESAMAPAHEKLVEARQSLESLLQSQSTDACSIGTAMLNVRQVSEQFRAAEKALDGKLASLLTADQKSKYDALKSADHFEERRVLTPGMDRQ
jgi:Spy/CpxP family protein refolding chaperone